jgi:ferredoxin-NADP reductase/MOSC domain-containing protein YiiM
MARLLSLNVGLPREITWNGKTVRTAIWKLPVTGRRAVRKLNIDGDAQADLAGHGGEQRAVFVYQMESYHYWEHFLGRNDFMFGQFGENFTVEGLADNEVCIGDRYRIGNAVFEVTQPRVTCYRLGIRMNEPRTPSLVVAYSRPGFYFRVLREGEVGAGDDIAKIADGPERMTVAEIDGLLYLPGHSREQLERALHMPALSQGWQSSFQAMVNQDESSKVAEGNPGLANQEPAPEWPGFRQMTVASIQKESDGVTSLIMTATDGGSLPIAQPGQFVVLRLQVEHAKPVTRCYSLSNLPSASHFRISVKSESPGLGSTFLSTVVRRGDVLEVSAPRGSFTLRSGEGPLVLLSAGIGATPVLSMLHQLAAERTQREVWWIYGARNQANHPFAQESRSLLRQLQRARGCIVYSRPTSNDELGSDFDVQGHIEVALLEKLGVPFKADFYLCGPSSFLKDIREGLLRWGTPAESVHTETFGSVTGITPGLERFAHNPHQPVAEMGSGPSVSFARSGINVAWSPKFGSLLEFAEACDVPVRWSCRTGVCHTCMTGLISGSITYRYEPLEKPPQGNVLVCCAQPTGDITLDL